MGSRSTENPKLRAWVDSGGAKASRGSFAEAARFGQIVVLALKGDVVERVLRDIGPRALAGKTVVDPTNPLDFSDPSAPGLFTKGGESLGQQIQKAIPDAHVVKAFNSIGSTFMVKPKIAGGPPDLYYCGNDEDANATVAQVAKDFGLVPVGLGGIASARYLESIAMAWITHGMLSGGWNHAFKLLHD